MALTRLRRTADRHRTRVAVPSNFAARAEFGKMNWLSAAGKNAMKYCREFAGNPERTRAPLLSGSSGTGKTHLLYATARAIARAAEGECDRLVSEEARRIIDHDDWTPSFEGLPWPRVEVLVESGSEIAHGVRSSVKNENIDAVVARYRQQEVRRAGGLGVLLVDDIEVCKMSDWLNEEFYRVLDWRYANAMPTPMATNMSPDELGRHFGDRIARRILDMTEPFVLG